MRLNIKKRPLEVDRLTKITVIDHLIMRKTFFFQKMCRITTVT